MRELLLSLHCGAHLSIGGNNRNSIALCLTCRNSKNRCKTGLCCILYAAIERTKYKFVQQFF